MVDIDSQAVVGTISSPSIKALRSLPVYTLSWPDRKGLQYLSCMDTEAFQIHSLPRAFVGFVGHGY